MSHCHNASLIVIFYWLGHSWVTFFICFVRNRQQWHENFPGMFENTNHETEQVRQARIKHFNVMKAAEMATSEGTEIVSALVFGPTFANAWWAHMHRFLSVTLPKFTGQ